MDSLPLLQGSPVSPRRERAFHIALAASFLVLLLTSWKLWTQQTDFPQVPLLAWAGAIPRFVELLCFGVAVAGLLYSGAASCFEKSGGPIALLLVAGAMALSILIDQHRLQPWAYQLVVFAIVLAALPTRRAFALLRLVVVSIYFWSAVAKLDYSFLDTQGQQFLSASFGLLGIDSDSWSPATRHGLAMAFPAAELLIAAGLCVSHERSVLLRRCVLAVVVILHVVLIAVLSPLGLNHQWPVIIWNFWFIAQALLLFGLPERKTIEVETPTPSWPREAAGVVVELLVAAVIVLPVFNLLDRFDHWPSWGLYAPRNSRATLYIHTSQVDHLPEELHEHISEANQGDWHRFRLDGWSLETLGVPIYPQDRFQVGTAQAVVREHNVQDGFQLIVEAPPDRWTGRREAFEIRTVAELDSRTRSYVLNSQPRESSR